MIGLKSYLPVLARHLNTSEATLYERQRKLTRDGLLVGTAGRGPGSGIRVTPSNVALMIMAMMATDDLAEVGHVDFLKASTSEKRRCPLTGASTFGKAFERLLSDEGVASTVDEVTVIRSTLEGAIVFRARTRGKSALDQDQHHVDVSRFGRDHARLSGLQSKHWLPGADVLAICRELAALTVGEPLKPHRRPETRDAKG